MIDVFTEVVVAPDFDDEALELFSTKKNLRVLRVAGLKPVDGQRVLALQQLERVGEDRQVDRALLGADRATALGNLVQIDLCAEPNGAAMTSAFTCFQHRSSPVRPA